ncbi:RING-type domain-containing protein, partial [Nephila pilipes]
RGYFTSDQFNKAYWIQKSQRIIMTDESVQLENVEFVQSCPMQFRCRRCSSLDSSLNRARCGHGFCGRCVSMVRAARFQCPVDSRSVEKKEVSSL